MTTNILALPLASMVIQTGTNEDWIDSLVFLIPDGSGIVAQYPQLDLTGISFRMYLRREPDDVEVILSASTDDGSLMIGDYPNNGYLIIAIDNDEMKARQAGAYVGDIVASDHEFTRRCFTFSLNLVEGVTR